MKKDKLYFTDFAAVGDVAHFDLNEDGTGVIIKIEDRSTYLSRKAPKIKGASYRGERLEQVIAANIDNVVITTSMYEPSFNNRTLDRLIVAAESSHLNIIIVLNKIDFDKQKVFIYWEDVYENMVGYNVIPTSTVTDEGLDELKAELENKKNIFWGQSGVGKSSLLNKIYPGLNLKVGSISTSTTKGKHTTVTAQMIPVAKKTFVIDTPGIREIDPYGIRKNDLGHYFIEFRKYLNDCKFNNCSHHHEPGCAVIEAVNNNLIEEHRYDSYLRILETIEEDVIF